MNWIPRTLSTSSGSTTVYAAISEIALPDVAKVRYTYDDPSSTGLTPPSERLVKVEQVNASNAVTETTIYHYEDTNFPFYVTGITDGRGVRATTYAYKSAAGPNTGGPVAPRYEPATTTSDPAVDPRGGTAASRAASAGSPTPAGTGGTASPSYEPERSPTAQPQQTGGRGQRVVADEPNSALLVTATRKEYQRILQILGSLDAMPTQVMLEAVIAEVTLKDELKFGLKWFFEKGNNKITLSDTTGGTIQANFPGFNYFFSIPSASVALDAVSSVTKVNVVSAPSLMVLDNRKASLQIGDQVPIVTQTAQNTTTIGAPIINSITLKDTGIILNVTPRVSDSGRVVLDIEQEVSSVVRTTSSGIDSPTIQQRKLRTTAVVGDGEQVALGGLIQERNNDTKGQVPILGDIPVIGTAFRQKNDKIDRTELLIFIRPVVVRNIDQARDVTQEFRDRLQVSPLTTSRGRNTYERDARRILQ